MPTVFTFMGYRFYFYANDHEPIHIHIDKGGATAKFDVLPSIKLVRNDGFKNAEIRMIEVLIEENREVIIVRWKEFFSSK